MCGSRVAFDDYLSAPLPNPVWEHCKAFLPSYFSSLQVGKRLSLCVLLCTLRVGASQVQHRQPVLNARAGEVQALRDLFVATQGSAWVRRNNWMSGDPCVQQWYGVTCTPVQKAYLAVTGLALPSNKLTGTLSTSITNLRGLLTLDLSGNSLVSSLPWNLGNLPSLRTLDLSQNGFTGSVPGTIGLLGNLSSLDLRQGP